MATTFLALVLGHMVADYMLQTKKMALTKSQPGFTGLLWCTVHCLVYTLCVCAFVGSLNLAFAGLVFASHFPVDRYSLASKWLKMVGSRDFMAAYASCEKYHEVDLAFSCLVYAVCDNTMHLVALWFLVKYAGHMLGLY